MGLITTNVVAAGRFGTRFLFYESSYAGGVIPAILIANAVFNVFAWPTFLRRVMKDPRARDARGRPTPFLTVHIVLVTIALVLAALSAVAAVLIIIRVW